MTLGPSRGAPSLPPPSSIQLSSAFATPNRFQPLSGPEYRPLCYIDVEVKGDNTDWITTRALLDSGGQGSFINDKLFNRYALPCLPKPRPISLILADGQPSKGGDIHSYTPVTLRIAGGEEAIGLDVAPTTHHIVLGVPWLEKHDPSISFDHRTLTFSSQYCRTHCSHYSKTIPLHPEPSIAENIPNAGTPCPASPITVPPTAASPNVVPSNVVSPNAVPSNAVLSNVEPPIAKTMPRRTRKNPAVATKATPRRTKRNDAVFKKAPSVSIVGAHAFAHLCNQDGVELFVMSFNPIPEEQELNNAAAAVPSPDTQEPDLSAIPPEYHDLADVFSEKEAKNLPAHRPYDHKIPLEPGTSPPFGPIYPMSPAELETLRKYCEDNLNKGFIRHSQSPCGAPVLFVKKPDGGLRLCVDYRGLNKITTPNRYPLPLIGELLDRISRARYYTKVDVRDGFYRLRMALGEEWKTAFRCRYGLFEYTVMPFGLCNAPGTFQHYMNDTFREFLDKFLVIYLDDLLIYSDTLAEHKKHVRAVLERLRDAGLYLKISKCQFHVQEVTFLGYVVGPNGIKMDPAKVEAITTWPAPQSTHDIRVFLGLANFYRRFIKNFSNAAAPLTYLLKKGRKFHWGDTAQKAFDTLKQAFTSAPILRHFNPDLPTVVEADASDFALGAVISQRDPADGCLHPITFHSRKFNLAEQNYEIYDKEMLAIVETMDQYRHYFEGLGQTVTVYSDHKNLLWFTETKVYNRRQARWAEKLSRFDFRIVFRPGKRSGKPDALSRRPDYTSGKNPEARTLTFLKPHQVDTAELASSAFTLNNAVVEHVGIDGDLLAKIRARLDDDPDLGPILHRLQNPENGAPQEGITLSHEGLLLKDGLIYIPANDELKVEILKRCHDARTAGHLGQKNTLERVSRDYYWPRMRQFINEYVRTCDTCARNKTPRHRPYGPLRPLPIPTNAWRSVSMDLIVELPESKGFNAIFVCVDRLTKMSHFIPTKTDVTAAQAAQLYVQNVFRLHGLPQDIVSDRGQHFTSHFTCRLLELCEIKGNRSTAFHPQSDGQTERTNQTLEQYLRIYCDYQQDDWHDLLPFAEFVYNNTESTSTRMTPFFANYGYHPRCNLSLTAPVESINPTAEVLVQKFRELHAALRTNLQRAQQDYKKYHDQHVKEAPTFKVGDKVWLNRTLQGESPSGPNARSTAAC